MSDIGIRGKVVMFKDVAIGSIKYVLKIVAYCGSCCACVA